MEIESALGIGLLLILTPFLTIALLVVCAIIWEVFSAIFIDDLPKELSAAAKRKGHKNLAERGKENLTGDYYD